MTFKVGDRVRFVRRGEITRERGTVTGTYTPPSGVLGTDTTWYNVTWKESDGSVIGTFPYPTDHLVLDPDFSVEFATAALPESEDEDEYEWLSGLTIVFSDGSAYDMNVDEDENFTVTLEDGSLTLIGDDEETVIGQFENVSGWFFSEVEEDD